MAKHSFEGKTCVITGACTGIGFGLGKVLLQRGAHVWMSSRTPFHVEAAKDKLAEFKDRAHFDVIDVRYADQVTSYINRIAEAGRIDYLFNNAGVGYKGFFQDATAKTWEDVLSVNLHGVIHGTTAAVPVMLRQGGGNIINTASVGGIVPLPYQSIYDTSKYAVVGFSESLRHEMAGHNIHVWAVCPGPVDTMIFKRGVDYVIHEEIPAPPDAISPEQAAEEILAGLETYTGILPITDFARQMYEEIHTDPAKVEEMMRLIAKQTEEDLKKSLQEGDRNEL